MDTRRAGYLLYCPSHPPCKGLQLFGKEMSYSITQRNMSVCIPIAIGPCAFCSALIITYFELVWVLQVFTEVVLYKFLYARLARVSACVPYG